MVQRLRRSRLAQVLVVLIIAAVYAVVGTGSHINQGHQTPIKTINPVWDEAQFHFKLLWGEAGFGGPGGLTVSFFPDPQNPGGINATVSNYLTQGVNNWTNQLKNNGPANFNFDVLTRITDSALAADIYVKIDSTICPGAPACAGPTGDSGHAQVTVTPGVYNVQTENFKKLALPHELGHAFGMLEDHYGSSLNCVSIMGNCSDPAPPTSPVLAPTAHDNDDVYDALNQASQLVASNYIVKQGLTVFDVRWEHDEFTTIPQKQHGESNFIIERATDHTVGFGFYSLSSRNSVQLDGLDRFGLPGNPERPDHINVNAGEHYCFRVRTENYVFSTNRGEHYGVRTSSDCIARTMGNVVISTNHIGSSVFVAVYNQGPATISNLQVTAFNGQGPSCSPTPSTLSQYQSAICTFTSTNSKWTLVLSYDGQVQGAVDYDSYGNN